MQETKDHIDHRRIRAFVMSENGISERDIARQLTISRTTVRRDLTFVRSAITNAPDLPSDGEIYSPVRHMKRTRHSEDGPSNYFKNFATIIPPDDHETDWRLMELDRETLNKVSPRKLLEMLANISPPYSRAIWDFIRLCDAGHEIKVYRPDTEEVYEEALAAHKEFESVLKQNYGSIKMLSGRLFMAGYVRGAMLAEVVLDKKRKPIDFVIPDPYTVRFKRVEDTDRGQRWQMGQMQDGEFVPLEYDTIRYFAHDPWPGSPYGRSPSMPALFPTLFLLGLMHDLRRVVAQQGYPRIDIALSLEKLAAAFPAVFKKGGEGWEKLIDDSLNDIESVYSSLEPDDAFVHTDDSEVKRPVGSLDGQAVQSADSLIKALERMSVQGLKTMPLMLGITDGVSEANANRQWEIMVAAIKSLQHMAETILSSLFKVALEAQGFIADVKVTFAELRASEMLRDEQTTQIRQTNAAFARDQSWMTELEAGTYGIGKDPSPDVVKMLKEKGIKDAAAEAAAAQAAADKAAADAANTPGTGAEPTDPAKIVDVGETKTISLVSARGEVLVLDPFRFTSELPDERELAVGVTG